MKFSKKQAQVLSWWEPTNENSSNVAVICDGAIRSGKTTCLALSFIHWAFATFESQEFALCGKTIQSLRRNVVYPLQALLPQYGYTVELIISRSELLIERDGVQHRFHLFGGKDEGSAALIQGITLAGILFDEVALMPRSFVEQALARCSVEQSRFWFNCNPEHPAHWFYKEWILPAKKRKVFYLHFTMEDNPSLTPAMRQRYHSLYTGVFYKKYILGKWVASHGAVYPMFSEKKHVVQTLPKHFSRYVISCDYGTTNPSSFGLWGCAEDIWYRMREYYHSSRDTGLIKTDEEYCAALTALAADLPIETILVDPSAASFIQCLRRQGHGSVTPASNPVLNGIRLVSSALMGGKLRFHASCTESIREFSLYRWKTESQKEEPLQQDDHAMDEIRYFVQYLQQDILEPDGFYAVSTPRRGFTP